jgi:hypothetical protein
VSEAFGDFEPEDAWDATDAIAIQIGNLLERFDLLDHVPGTAGRWRGCLVDLEYRLRPYVERRATGQLSERDALRVDQLVEDLLFVRQRDDDGQ